MNVGFEWKAYGSDEPESLKERLLEAGFEEGEPESLMVYELSKFRSASKPVSLNFGGAVSTLACLKVG